MSGKDAAGVPERTLDRRGRLRSPAAMPGYHKGRAPVTKGQRYPENPMRIEDIVALREACAPKRAGRQAELSALRLRTLILILWRTGMRISEALALEETDLDHGEQTITVREGKGAKRRVVVMDNWGWQEFQPWLDARTELPYGPIFCVLSGPTAGQAMSDSDARRQLRSAAKKAGLRRRANPHCFRHTAALEWYREDLSEVTIQAQLGHSRLDVTSVYLGGLGANERTDWPPEGPDDAGPRYPRHVAGAELGTLA